MVPQKNRLGRGEFTLVYKHGRKAHTLGFLLVYANAPDHKVAVVVGKKVAKSAVARNRLKRRLYAILSEANLPPGRVIVVAKPSAQAYTFEQLRSEIMSALARLGAGSDSR